MSYILHIWEHPSSLAWPATVGQADQFLTVARSIHAGRNQKYIAFASALTQVYPDLESVEEADDGLEKCVWADSPINGQTEASIYTIGLVSAHLDQELLYFIAHAGCDQGLHMFDMQAGVLYRPDRTTIDLKGDARVLPLFGPHRLPGALEDVETRVKTSISGFSIQGAAKELIHDIARYYAVHDFMPHVPRTVQLEMKAQTRNLPESVDDFQIWFFPRYSPSETVGLSEEEINERKREDVRREKQRLLDVMISIRQYCENI